MKRIAIVSIIIYSSILICSCEQNTTKKSKQNVQISNKKEVSLQQPPPATVDPNSLMSEEDRRKYEEFRKQAYDTSYYKNAKKNDKKFDLTH